ncbi:MAG: beta-ketoacyl-[acyl-carrier-protein] synthase family protein [Desulfatibacillaceae bacterium]
MPKDKRVVITGMGLRTPVGNTLADFAQSLKDGVSGVVQVPEWAEIGNLRCRVGGACRDVGEDAVPRKYRRTMGRVALLAAVATDDAIEDSGISRDLVASDRCGVSFGSTAGSCSTQETVLRRLWDTMSTQGMSASSYLHYMSHTCAANVAMMFSVQGPVVAPCTACVSGSQGVGYGYEQILLGRCDAMLCGGAEELHYMDAVVFDVMRATSTKYNDEPHRTPRPFDAARDGLVVSEGAGALVLEDYGHAKARDARIYAEILGYGNNCDGHHLTTAQPDGIAAAIRRALADANMPADDIAYICAHATATSIGDVAEAEATHRIFGDRVPVSSLKGHMGHTLGAAGAVESIATILMMREKFVAPTLNLENPDTRCAPLGHVMGPPRNLDFSTAMNNNFAFGGLNTSLIFSLV